MSNITAGGVQFIMMIITVRQYGLYCSAPKQNWGLQDTHSIATTHCTAYKLLSISMQQSKDSSSTQPLRYEYISAAIVWLSIPHVQPMPHLQLSVPQRLQHAWMRLPCSRLRGSSGQDVSLQRRRQLPGLLEAAHVQNGLAAGGSHAAAIHQLGVCVRLLPLQQNLPWCVNQLAHSLQRPAHGSKLCMSSFDLSEHHLLRSLTYGHDSGSISCT